MAFHIKITATDHSFDCESDEAVLAAALRQGVSLPYGCRNGACATCLGKVLSGEVFYPDGLPMALSEEDHQSGMALFCQAIPKGDLELEAKEISTEQQIEIKTLPVRVEAMEKLSGDVMRLCLRLPATERLQFLAGQWIDMLMKDGKRRGFSIANAPHADDHIELHIRHVVGGVFTDFVFNQLKNNDLLRFEGPHGSFFLREDSERPLILIAGGTGFAPLKGILEHAFEAGINRPMHLFWGVRGKKDLYFEELPQRWLKEHENFSYTPVLSEPDATDEWLGETGFVHEAVVKVYKDLTAYSVYMAGPPVMIGACKTAFEEQGLPSDELFFDSFEYSAAAQKAIDAEKQKKGVS